MSKEGLLDHIARLLGLQASQIEDENNRLQLFCDTSDSDVLYVASNESHASVAAESSAAFGSEYPNLMVMIKPKGEFSVSDLHWWDLPIRKPGEEGFESVRSLLDFVLIPYFENISTESSANPSQNLGRTRKKFNELSLALQHLQQTIEIPNLLQSTHLSIQKISDESDVNLKVLAEDPELLNQINNTVLSWMRQIKNVTALDHAPLDSESLLEHVHFWKSMDLALAALNNQISSPEVQRTLQVLNLGKRQRVVAAFESETGIKDATEKSLMMNAVLKDLPLEDMLSISNDDGKALSKLELALQNLFTYLKRLKNYGMFSISRAKDLLSGVYIEITKKLIHILQARVLLNINIEAFNEKILLVNSFLSTLEDNVTSGTELLRELSRKRDERLISIKVDQSISSTIKKSLSDLSQLRFNYDELLAILKVTDKDGGQTQVLNNSWDQLNDACNPFDFSKSGVSLWQSKKNTYLETYFSSLGKVKHIYGSKISHCSDLSQMTFVLREFSDGKVKDLLPNLLLDTDKINVLHIAQKEFQMLQEVNLKMVISIEAAGQKEQWLTTLSIRKGLLARVISIKSILGKVVGNWEHYSIGSKLQSDINAFVEMIDSQALFDQWVKSTTESTLPLTSESKNNRIIKVVECLSLKNIDVSMNERIGLEYELFQEFSNLGFDIPFAVENLFKNFFSVLSISDTIKESIEFVKDIIMVALHEPKGTQTSQLLLQQPIENVIESIRNLSSFRWFHFQNLLELNEFALASENLVESKALRALNNFQDLVQILHEKRIVYNDFDHKLQRMYDNLERCEFKLKEVQLILSVIELELRKLSLQTSEFDDLVDKINENIGAILSRKCEQELKRFSEAIFTQNIPVSFELIASFDGRNLLASPLVQATKSQLVDHMNSLLSIIQKKYFILTGQKTLTTYEILESVKEAVLNVLNSIDQLIDKVQLYLTTWKELLILFEVNLNDSKEVSLLLNYDLSFKNWFRFTRSVLQASTIFNTPQKSEGCISIDFSRVLPRSHVLFEEFNKSFFQVVFGVLDDHLVSMLKDVNRHVKKLEQDFTGMLTTEDKVLYVNILINLESRLATWNEQCFMSKNLEQKLEVYHYGQDRYEVTSDLVRNRIQVLESLTKLRYDQLKGHGNEFGSELSSAIKQFEVKITAFKNDWDSKNVFNLKDSPSVIFTELKDHQAECQRLLELHTAFKVTGEMLELDIMLPERKLLESVLIQIEEFLILWKSILDLWTSLEVLRQLSWSENGLLEVRQRLENILQSLKNLKPNIQKFDAVKEIKNAIKSFLKNFRIINDLKSASLKTRHWKRIGLLLNKPAMETERITWGTILDLDLEHNKSKISNVLTQASIELTLQEALEEMKERWTTYTFTYYDFEGVCLLIKNGKEILDKCGHDLRALSSMKNSAHFKTFDSEVAVFENRLSQFVSLLDAFVEIQRVWTYLYGVFGQNRAEIRSVLPIESTRFQNITLEFFEVLRRIQTYETARFIFEIPNVSHTFKDMGESLQKITRALSEFLESQRDIFPRFYLIGNEDLLELMSASKDISMINKHIRKMYFGVQSIVVENDNLVKVQSDDDEQLEITDPITLNGYDRLIDWLGEFEYQLKISLAKSTRENLHEHVSVFDAPTMANVHAFVLSLPGQVQFLISKIKFTKQVTSALSENSLSHCIKMKGELIRILSAYTTEVDDSCRRKLEHLIIEELHHREILCSLEGLPANVAFNRLLREQLYYLDTSSDSLLSSLKVHQGGSQFTYGFEYLGVPDKLAYTQLIDKCNLTMSEAVAHKLGGAPFGPAGTGKTEAIKALGYNLGQMVVLFCCDDTFDYQSMSRLFIGICRIGCWGCFDEFNRLNERILSAVSSLIERIESSLTSSSRLVTLSDKEIKVNDDTAIFITMNPGYAGRYELPENLKRLFVGFSMKNPDGQSIAEVLLASRNFLRADTLSVSLAAFLNDLASSTTDQLHYDFGLRAMKRIIDSCGTLYKHALKVKGEPSSENQEVSSLLQSLHSTILPKLVDKDVKLFHQLIKTHFGNISIDIDDEVLKQKAIQICAKLGYDLKPHFLEKLVQLYEVQKGHQGVILVGSTDMGKSVCQKVLLMALEELEGVENLTYVIDCKILSKEELYGSLDPITREWTDGLITSILRRINNNIRGESSKRIWVTFDGDVDPEWAENLNSVLDDNKVLTLPNGERLKLPDNVRLLFEVSHLKFATPATVSRCGMVYFNNNTVTIDMILHNLKFGFKQKLVEYNTNEKVNIASICDFLDGYVSDESLLSYLDISKKLVHVLRYDKVQSLRTYFVRLRSYIKRMLKSDDYFSDDDIHRYLRKATALSLTWALAGDCSLEEREKFAKELFQGEWKNEKIGNDDDFICIDYDVSLPSGTWLPLSLTVQSDLQPLDVMKADTVIPTLDTMRHEELLFSLLHEHEPIVLCGPPGSGKTMTVMEALRRSNTMDVIALNFSKDSTPQLLIKSLEAHCAYKRFNNSLVLTPKVPGKWAVVFCDEINLPAYDKYETQKVIAALRQLIEQNGFWIDNDWVTLQNIQFVGACNPSTHQGRNVLPDRFLRHTTVIMVDHPGKKSLRQIYLTFTRALLNLAPNLKGFSNHLTEAMLDVYHLCFKHFSQQEDNFYVYSPRELTRWCRGILVILREKEHTLVTNLLRSWFHEGLRLFCDRISNESDKTWVITQLKQTLESRFTGLKADEVLKEPILYSTWITLHYEEVTPSDLLPLISERLKLFGEEEKDLQLVLYDDMIDYILRIDRVLRQPQGHLILVGPSASGRTTLCRFVSWMNGLKVYQLTTHNNYHLQDFEEYLRNVLRACAKGEGVCLIIDECSVIDVSFIERMNSILANAEAPGLFENEELQALYSLCKEQSQLQGLSLETDSELYDWFRSEVSSNLHVTFTMSESSNILTSPALLNRCVLSWMGDWTNLSMFQTAHSFVQRLPIDSSNYTVPSSFKSISGLEITNMYEVVSDTLVSVHRLACATLSVHSAQFKKLVSPAYFVRFINEFLRVYSRQAEELEQMQSHTMNGLNRLRGAVLEVKALKQKLSDKQAELSKKDDEARNTLNKLLTDQNEAERRHEFSIETQKALERQEKDILERKKIVMSDLAEAEPAVQAAQKGVQNIKKQHLTELRSMGNPPAAVKMTIESVCILLGFQASSWREAQSILRKDDFITSIVGFDNESQVTAELLDYMNTAYLSRPDYSYETVDRASKACGPLLAWVKAQLSYAAILDNIGPLRDEVKRIESHARKTKAQLIAIDEMIRELDEEIETLKNNYMLLIRETEVIRQEMTTVENKMNRSLRLIDSLNLEKDRWHSTIEKYSHFKENLVGNALVSSGMLVYSGILSERSRIELVSSWGTLLADSSIPYNNKEATLSSLTNPDTRLEWRDCGLVQDELNIQNMTIIGEGLKSDWVPLIIDPEDALPGIISNQNTMQKTLMTSFFDPNYVTNVENALKFGTPLLIRDAEFYNHNLDPIIRKDFHRNGGRLIVDFNSHEVDVTPGFKLYLHTKDLDVVIDHFVISRVTVVNFSVTSSSLETAALNLILETYNKDIQIQRSESIALQERYKVLLHEIEADLLASLSNADGRFLENDEVVDSLENIKKKALEVDEKYKAAARVLHEVEDLCLSYSEVTRHVPEVFGALSKITGMNSFYNFSLSFFLKFFVKFLGYGVEPKSDMFVQGLYREAFKWISSSMTQRDKIAAVIILVEVYLETANGTKLHKLCHDVLKGVEENAENQLRVIFEDLGSDGEFDINEVKKLLENNSDFSVYGDLIESIVGKAQGSRWAEQAFKAMSTQGQPLEIDIFNDYFDLKDWIKQDEQHTYVLPSLKGADATSRVELLARHYGKELNVISMGTVEGSDLGEMEIEGAALSGRWILIQNGHMSPEWILTLPRKLFALNLHQNFKLFITCSLTSTLLSAFLQTAHVLTFEKPPSLKSNVQVALTIVNEVDNTSSIDGQQRRIFLLLAWFHSVVLERLRYDNLEGTQQYEVNDSTLLFGARILVDVLVRKESAVPWDYICYMMGTIVYGGLIGSDSERQYVAELANKVFCEQALHQHSLVEQDTFLLPEYDESSISTWVQSIPEQTPLTWIGLPEEVSLKAKESEVKAIARKCLEVL